MDRLPDISRFRKRFEALENEMADEKFFSDRRKAAELSKEHSRLALLLSKFESYEMMKKSISDSANMAKDPSLDQEMRDLAAEDVESGNVELDRLVRDILLAMIPGDKSDSRNTVIEIRAGTGGDEASLFAGDLYRMYTRYAERRGWTVEILGTSASECGGVKEISFLISGDEVYKNLKFESGVHRVQRIPTTEANGRIHTSAATVAVLPEAEEVDIHIAPEELEISICRASGPGGQGVNTTDSAVQILHRPTGMIVTCADERSQQKNRVKAMTVLRSRLLQKKEEEEHAKYAADRKSQVGSGDRSERIRTYNFPQNRLTDHRIQMTLYSLPQIMDGDLDELVNALILFDTEQKIEGLLTNKC
ncbi:MAG: peptide chain release factor 1 [Puniceicoccales bacterium]|jgi:peptide chain release factor 1|nr:peptide chain release factor 1 [Puniceicoccales bacterium]